MCHQPLAKQAPWHISAYLIFFTGTQALPVSPSVMCLILCTLYKIMILRKIGPKVVSLLRKWQISGMCLRWLFDDGFWRRVSESVCSSQSCPQSVSDKQPRWHSTKLNGDKLMTDCWKLDKRLQQCTVIYWPRDEKLHKLKDAQSGQMLWGLGWGLKAKSWWIDSAVAKFIAFGHTFAMQIIFSPQKRFSSP